MMFASGPRWRRTTVAAHCLMFLLGCAIAGVEFDANAPCLSRRFQIPLNLNCARVRTTEDAPHDPCRVLERRHCLAEIIERGVGVLVERPPRKPAAS